MLQLTSGTTHASSSSYDLLQLQRGSINNSPNRLQALLGNLQGSPSDSDLSMAVTLLHNNGTVLQLLPQASSTDAMPLVLQMPGSADQGMHMQVVDASLSSGMQAQQQGCFQAPAQQVLLVDGTTQLATCAGADDSNPMELQVQQLNSQSAAVQQLLLSTQAGTPQGLVPVADASDMVSRLGH
jgi:hypothetical protein